MATKFHTIFELYTTTLKSESRWIESIWRPKVSMKDENGKIIHLSKLNFTPNITLYDFVDPDHYDAVHDRFWVHSLVSVPTHTLFLKFIASFTAFSEPNSNFSLTTVLSTFNLRIVLNIYGSIRKIIVPNAHISMAFMLRELVRTTEFENIVDLDTVFEMEPLDVPLRKFARMNIGQFLLEYGSSIIITRRDEGIFLFFKIAEKNNVQYTVVHPNLMPATLIPNDPIGLTTLEELDKSLPAYRKDDVNVVPVIAAVWGLLFGAIQKHNFTFDGDTYEVAPAAFATSLYKKNYGVSWLHRRISMDKIDLFRTMVLNIPLVAAQLLVRLSSIRDKSPLLFSLKHLARFFPDFIKLFDNRQYLSSQAWQNDFNTLLQKIKNTVVIDPSDYRNLIIQDRALEYARILAISHSVSTITSKMAIDMWYIKSQSTSSFFNEIHWVNFALLDYPRYSMAQIADAHVAVLASQYRTTEGHFVGALYSTFATTLAICIPMVCSVVDILKESSTEYEVYSLSLYSGKTYDETNIRALCQAILNDIILDLSERLEIKNNREIAYGAITHVATVLLTAYARFIVFNAFSGEQINTRTTNDVESLFKAIDPVLHGRFIGILVQAFAFLHVAHQDAVVKFDFHADALNKIAQYAQAHISLSAANEFKKNMIALPFLKQIVGELRATQSENPFLKGYSNHIDYYYYQFYDLHKEVPYRTKAKLQFIEYWDLKVYFALTGTMPRLSLMNRTNHGYLNNLMVIDFRENIFPGFTVEGTLLTSYSGLVSKSPEATGAPGATGAPEDPSFPSIEETPALNAPLETAEELLTTEKPVILPILFDPKSEDAIKEPLTDTWSSWPIAVRKAIVNVFDRSINVKDINNKLRNSYFPFKDTITGNEYKKVLQAHSKLVAQLKMFKDKGWIMPYTQIE